MNWIQFADKHADGLGMLAFFILIFAAIAVYNISDAWMERGSCSREHKEEDKDDDA